jgi:hypothetical protein
MNDRELLEMAAKAVVRPEHYASQAYMLGWNSNWNPLTNDGDALRLAVALGLTVGPESPDVIGKSLCRVSWLNKTHSLGDYGSGDKMAATRLAITRAAAEIGRAMK